MPSVRDQAICTRVWDWSETSQTVALFARELGMVRALAKGSRRADARFSGGLEPTARGEMIAIVKPAERAPDSMATLTAWDLQEVFPPVRSSLSGFRSGMYIVDLVYHAIRDSDPHPELFDATLGALRSLGGTRADAAAVLRHQWAVLDFTGHAPDLGHPGAPRAGASYLEFRPSLGTVVGPGALSPVDASSGETAWRVRPETVDLLRRVASSVRDDLGAGFDAPDEVAARANRFLASYLRVVIGSWPPSVALLFPGLVSAEL